MDKKQILFLLSHQPNPRFVKQIKYLSTSNYVNVVYFYRDYMKDLSDEYNSSCKLNENIASISNGNYLQRIGKYLQSVQKLYKILKVNKYDTLIVNNIDTLALFKICTLFRKTNTKIVIEISDLRSHTYTNSLKSKVIRAIEQFIFRFVDKLIVTSPKFYEMYYNKLFNSNYFVLENKPLSNMIPPKLEKIKNDKTVIGIVGLLLQGKPYERLFETVKNDDRFEVHIYGKGTYQKLVEEYANKYENIKYFGEYNFFQDSAKIYSSLDILYMPYDTTNGSLNNKIALPNKLYEAMYFQVPIITSSSTYLGELVEDYGIGKTIKCCDKKELIKSIENINDTKIFYGFERLQSNKYLADEDYLKLGYFINE
ncbi:glycosyltransferase [Aliarcobacter butzleri]|uniref:glycosyltransferase n=1 Tax=Aliarcobacter butzleri TaxID=28197 RepID=UPI0012610027|nr:glycosyltransferase [Aliarcobacter butzleri]MCT7653105.1 glycosyltransferase [Aliarcobacter butzleri]MDN5045619.1 glycosyltransferase [Aliarcobacter butzleri]